MSQVILQPSESNIARINFLKTIDSMVPLERVCNFIKNDHVVNKLRSIYSNNECQLWGIVPGKNRINGNYWQKIKIGSICLFIRDGGIYKTGIVTYKLQNEALADDLWRTDEDGETWEFIYFLKDIRDYIKPYSEFIHMVWNNKKYVQRFTILNEAVSNSLNEKFNFY